MILLRMSPAAVGWRTFFIWIMALGAMLLGIAGPAGQWQRQVCIVLGPVLVLFAAILTVSNLRRGFALVTYTPDRVWSSGPMKLGYKELRVEPGTVISISGDEVSATMMSIKVRGVGQSYTVTVGKSVLRVDDRERLKDGFKTVLP